MGGRRCRVEYLQSVMYLDPQILATELLYWRGHQHCPGHVLEGCLLGFFFKKRCLSLPSGKDLYHQVNSLEYYRAYLLACLNTTPHLVCWGFVHFPAKTGHGQVDWSPSTCLPHRQDMGQHQSEHDRDALAQY